MSPLSPLMTPAHVPVASGALTMNGCTVIGKVYASLLSLASNCIFIAALSEADISPRLRSGMRRSGPRGASRAACASAMFRPAPFCPASSVRGAGAGHARSDVLFAPDTAIPPTPNCCPRPTRRSAEGADDGGEMGAYHSILAPQREADLLTRLAEYIPVGMEYGIFYES